MKKNRLINLHYGDMTDSSSLIRIIQNVQPDEIYNLAAQSHVKAVSYTHLDVYKRQIMHSFHSPRFPNAAAPVLHDLTGLPA